jgi:prefoldin beta subunit
MMEMENKVPQQLQHQLGQYQQIRQQYQEIALQRRRLESQLNEAKLASEELDKIQEDDTVYKAVGNLMVKVGKEEAKKDLDERTETLELRIKVHQRQETKIVNRMKEMEAKIRGMTGGEERVAPAG